MSHTSLYFPKSVLNVSNSLTDVQSFLLSLLFRGSTTHTTYSHVVAETDSLSVEEFLFASDKNMPVRNFHPNIRMSIEDFNKRRVIDAGFVIPNRYINDKAVTWKEWSKVYKIENDFVLIETELQGLQQYHLVSIHTLEFAKLVL